MRLFVLFFSPHLQQARRSRSRLRRRPRGRSSKRWPCVNDRRGAAVPPARAHCCTLPTGRGAGGVHRRTAAALSFYKNQSSNPFLDLFRKSRTFSFFPLLSFPFPFLCFASAATWSSKRVERDGTGTATTGCHSSVLASPSSSLSSSASSARRMAASTLVWTRSATAMGE